METILSIDNIRVKAYHGWYDAERKIGGMYTISVKIYDTTDISESFSDMDDSVNYEDIYDIVIGTMKKEFHLIEHCCKAMWDVMKLLKPEATWEVSLVKEDVPLKYVGSTSFTVKA